MEAVYQEEFHLRSGPYDTDCYDSHSAHFLLTNGGEAVGYIRIIDGALGVLPAFAIAQSKVGLDRACCVEFSRLMVSRTSRGMPAKRISLELMTYAFDYALQHKYLYVIADVFMGGPGCRLRRAHV
jgi:N-acyl-L-homoserine lactone synthetase